MGGGRRKMRAIVDVCVLRGVAMARKRGVKAGGAAGEGVVSTPLRAPAVPLLPIDPYFSLWSMADRLTDEFPKHWTGVNHSLTGMVRVDGEAYRFIGPQPEDVKAAEQVAVQVWPTRTVYVFVAGGAELTVTFMTPSVPGNLHTLSWPVGYVTFEVKSRDGDKHAVELYFDLCAEWCVDSVDQQVTGSRLRCEGVTCLSFGTVAQKILGAAGDDRRIDWGYVYLVLPDQEGDGGDGVVRTCISPKHAVQDHFVRTGEVPDCDDLDMPRAVSDGWPAIISRFGFKVGGEGVVRRHLLLVYDDLFSVEYLHRKVRPYWNRGQMGVSRLIKAAVADYEAMVRRCEAFDRELMEDLRLAGGEKYAHLCALSYRQTLAAHKLCADIDGKPLYFSKENFSNGCIATVDVTYPSAPFFLLFNPVLLEAQLTPIFEYASTPRWRLPYAPHDLGTYPLANGQTYGGGEKSDWMQMPVEECGNMILCTAALAKAHGHLEYVWKWWKLLTKWAVFLKEKGFDPEKQLCTDDFAGRLAHNTNLSIKAILALGAYADLCGKLGLVADAAAYREVAEGMVKSWVKAAKDRGGQYRLSFDRPGTWSMKYNLVWDELLGLKLFPPEVVEKELAFYLKKQERYGLPLDGRKAYAKIDWIGWVAAMGGKREWDALMKPVYRWVNETKSRVPLTDHYWADSGEQVIHLKSRGIGFQARSVVGGIFLKMLKEEGVWRKYLEAARGEAAKHHL